MKQSLTYIHCSEYWAGWVEIGTDISYNRNSRLRWIQCEAGQLHTNTLRGAFESHVQLHKWQRGTEEWT